MRIQAEEITKKELKPGDLYSDTTQEDWDSLVSHEHIVGYGVSIRSDNPCPGHLKDAPIFRLTIHQDDKTAWRILINEEQDEPGVLTSSYKCPHRYEYPSQRTGCEHKKHPKWGDSREVPYCFKNLCPIKR